MEKRLKRNVKASEDDTLGDRLEKSAESRAGVTRTGSTCKLEGNEKRAHWEAKNVQRIRGGIDGEGSDLVCGDKLKDGPTSARSASSAPHFG